MKGVKKMAHRNEKLAIGATCFFLIIAITMMIATIALCCSINSQEREFKLRQLAYEEEAAEREAKRQAEIEAVKAEIHAETLARKAAETQAHEAEEARQEAEAKALAEAEARQEAESKAYAADEARQEAESKAIAAEEARMTAETKAKTAEEARMTAESKAQAAEEAQKKAETKALAEAEARKSAEAKVVAEAYAPKKSETDAKVSVADSTINKQTEQTTKAYGSDQETLLLQEFLYNNGLSMDDFIVTLTRVVYAEACGEKWEGKVGVAEVYLNWIQADMFHSISEFENGYARISLERYYQLKWSSKEEERQALQQCEDAVRAAINGESPVEELLGGVKPYYFYLPEKSDPANVYVLQRAKHQIWVGNQLYTGLEEVNWTLKTQYYQYQP